MRFVYKETYDRTSKADIMRVIISLLSLWVLCSASRDSRTIPLSVNDVRQGIETRKGHDAKMAIDGDLSTFSLAEGNESWWMIDLKKTYQISQVIITASHDAENAKYLHSFFIRLEDENSKREFCYEYTSTESLAPSETRSFPCEVNNFQTRFIKITTDESNEQKKLALAEVTIISGLPPSKILLSGDEITLAGAIQDETMKKEANFAIDKNVMTFSLAVSSSAKDHAWLQVELTDNYDVGEVILTASHDMDYAKTLQNFVIWLLKSDKSPMTCKKYMSEMSLAPRETRPFRCQDRQVHTKFVRIERIGGSYKPNELAIAEVKVKTRSSPFTITPNSEFRIEIPLAGNLATQSDTVWLHGGNLATDGDVNTFAVAKPLLTFPDIKHELWWQVDLEGYYQVGRVILTASVDQEYTHCLHNFTILLINENNEMHFCNGYKSSGHFYPLPTRSFVCENDIFLARYIRIQGHGSISDTLALAEVRAFTGFSRRM